MTRATGGRRARAAVTALLLGLALLTAGASTVAGQAAGTLRGSIPSQGGVALVTWSGGPVEAVPGVAAESGCAAISAWVTAEGDLIGHVFRAPSFVNARFGSVTGGGNLAPSAPLVLVCGAGTVAPTTPPPAAALEAPDLASYLPSSVEVAGYSAALRSRDAGQYEQAAVQFGQLASAGGTLAPVAMMRAAQMLQIADRDADAVEAFNLALSMGGLPPSLEMVARLDAANALWSLDRGAEVLDVLGRVTLGNGATASQLAQAGWLRAQAKRDTGDAGWMADALSVVSNYPGSSSARAALNAIEGRTAIPPLDAAYVRYLHHQNVDARSAYQQIATAGGSDAAIAWFYLGALAERAGDRDEAIEAYRLSVQLDGSSRVADDAHWWAADLLDDAGRDDEAVEHWSSLSAGYPSSPFATDAGVRAALALTDSGAFDAAASVLRTMLERSTGTSAARAARWLRVLDQEAPSPTQYDVRSISAILDAAGDDTEAPLPEAARGEWGTDAGADWAEAAAWMQARYGAPPGGAFPGADTVRVALALAEAGEGSVARSVLYAHMRALESRPYDLLALSRLASAAGLHDISISAAGRLLDGTPSNARLQTPRAIERLAYPTPFASEILAAAQAEGIPPLLLAALVRRESLFNPEAGSSAGAQGLAQVVPATGREIAASLGVPWDPAMLFDPATSLRFGAHYLSTQLARFDGNVWNALSAYNGGPGNASRWSRSQPYPGADWYIETVDFSETRLYLRVVMEDYAWYRYLYAGAPAPTIR